MPKMKITSRSQRNGAEEESWPGWRAGLCWAGCAARAEWSWAGCAELAGLLCVAYLEKPGGGSGLAALQLAMCEYATIVTVVCLVCVESPRRTCVCTQHCTETLQVSVSVELFDSL